MAQKTISAAEAGQDLTRFLREVSAGQDQYIVEADGVPLVAVVPMSSVDDTRDRDRFIEQMERAAAHANLSQEEAERLIEEAIADVRAEQRVP
ncbi:MAG: type II toxin-antitoxin system prevent-host-death family antitoxin [Thermomicrobiales bacterium]